MLLGFKKRFAPPILAGTKIFTIREPRKNDPKLGEPLYMYTGLRTKHCEKITFHHQLKSIHLVEIIIFQQSNGNGWMNIDLDGKQLNAVETEKFVRMDGFEDERDFVAYWLQSIKPDDKGTRYAEFDDMALYAWKELKL